MTYSKAPATSTYQKKQLSLITDINSRSELPAKDADYLNFFVEKIKSKNNKEAEAFLRKRAGCASFLTMSSTSIRGIYYIEDTSRLYIAVGRDVVIYSMPVGTLVTTLLNVFGTSSGDVGMTEFLYDTGVVKLVVTDGTTLSTIDSSNVVVVGADADMPVPHLPQIVFLDGYLFMVKEDTADLYNSNLNDPLAYTAGDFISSELVADRVTHLVRLNNYILTFGSNSIEYFWDAANDTGSPLQRNDTPIKLTGTVGGIAQQGNKIFFVGDATSSEVNVYMLEDFKITPLGTEVIRRYLTQAAAGLYANLLSVDGHDFYILYAGVYTYVYDLSTQFWYRWGFQSLSYFDINYSFNVRVGTQYIAVFTRVGDDTIYRFDTLLYQDDGSNITAIARLDNEEFDTHNQKTMSKLVIWSDMPTSSSALLVQWSDDDYQTFNAGVTVELYQEHPTITRLGRFRRRAFKITHTANQPLRIKAIEVDLNLGQN